MNVLLLKMGGSGTRFGSELPKQFHMIDGQPLFCYILKKYYSTGLIDKYIIVTNNDYYDYTKKWAEKILNSKLYKVVSGGSTSARSSKNGIIAAKEILQDDDIILFHDSTNPIVITSRIIDVINAAKEYCFASFATEQVHAIYSKDTDDFAIANIDKNSVCSGYSPEAFKFKNIYECFINSTEDELDKSTSAISLCKQQGMKTKLIIDSFPNLKITYKNDLDFFKIILKGKGEI